MSSNLLITALLFITAIAGGLFVYYKNPRNISNRIYLLASLCAGAWVASYRLVTAVSTSAEAQLFVSAAQLSALALLFAIAWLTFHFPKPLKNLVKIRYLLISMVVGMILSAADYVERATVNPISGEYEFSYEPGVILYTAILIYLAYVAARNLYKGYKSSTARIYRSQIKFMLFGTIITISTGITLAIIAPIIFPDRPFDVLAPFTVYFYQYYTGRAIVQARLFNLRQILVQIFSLILTLATVVSLYFTLSYLIDIKLFNGDNQSARTIFNIAFASQLIFSYSWLHDLIEKFLSRAAQKDNYDTQLLLDELNQLVVSKVGLSELLESVAALIQSTMRSSFCGFFVRETSYFESRFLVKGVHSISPNDLDKIRQISPLIKRKIHSAELEPESNEELILNEVMIRNHIELIGRLVDTLDYEIAGVGFFVLGPRHSKNPYSEQDMKVMEIIANELVVAVENALKLEEIEQFNISLQKNIDSAKSELKRSNNKLLALDEAKDEFVSMASHQLRTPLTSIKGYLSMLLDGDAGPLNEPQEKMLGQAFFSSQRMVYLISDLLNVSRLKTGKFVIESKPVNLSELIESELDQLHNGAEAKNITLVYQKPKKFPDLELDELKIRQVIMNFVDNAIYYTPTGGKITIELKDLTSSIELRVQDSGIGVPKSQQHKLFTKFFRADNARKARPDGTGLGLFMAKKVIIAQNGSIIFESKENKGSTFGFNFPKARLLSSPEE